MTLDKMLAVVLAVVFALALLMDAMERRAWLRFKAQHGCERGQTVQDVTQWNCAKGLTLWKGPQYE